jgi:hypothetical protein
MSYEIVVTCGECGQVVLFGGLDSSEEATEWMFDHEQEHGKEE